jgi:hypothetical protein
MKGSSQTMRTLVLRLILGSLLLYKNSTRTSRFAHAFLPNSAHGDLLTGTDRDARGRTPAEIILNFVNTICR